MWWNTWLNHWLSYKVVQHQHINMLRFFFFKYQIWNATLNLKRGSYELNIWVWQGVNMMNTYLKIQQQQQNQKNVQITWKNGSWDSITILASATYEMWLHNYVFQMNENWFAQFLSPLPETNDKYFIWQNWRSQCIHWQSFIECDWLRSSICNWQVQKFCTLF